MEMMKVKMIQKNLTAMSQMMTREKLVNPTDRWKMEGPTTLEKNALVTLLRMKHKGIQQKSQTTYPYYRTEKKLILTRISDNQFV